MSTTHRWVLLGVTMRKCTANRVMRAGALVSAGLLTAGLLAGCAPTASPVADADANSTSDARPRGFPAGGVVDYQLGGAYDPAQEVEIVSRDRMDAPDPDRYSICYVNGFQTQPGELSDWPEDALLANESGPVIDPDWPNEVLLNTATEAARAQILEVVAPWITKCAKDGYNAVEFDNLDTYTRSNGALTREGNVALAQAYVEVAHDAGLDAGQKNAAEDAELLHAEAGFDFAVSEECGAYRECADYTEVYGDAVIDIEYADELPRSFAEMCADPETPASVVLRDRDLSTPDDQEYVFETCA
ncbi:endo alpha-1,4 polygalactosaminidase [Leucobacter musarum]|uniref:endo alpha-1,4 polygalactosaminidase n=1 Tax=Leucobacter musarum TaxID=1930747 RepID=UPI001EFB9BE2|nr:endo alpha-1,4 polygalactosaminidase [Leucobacter musarum]